MGSRSQQSTAAGFTLLEVLVVLAITSLLSVLLIDGIGQVLMIESRMGARTSEFREDQLREHWLRQLFSGVTASNDYPSSVGEARVSGLTLSPLLQEQGIPTYFELAVIPGQSVTELLYTEGEVSYTLMRVDNAQMRDVPRILALQDDGTYTRDWLSKERGSQWPRGLALQLPWLDGDVLWHVAIEGRRIPRRSIEEALGI